MESKEFDKWAEYYDNSIASSDDVFPFDGYYDVLSEIIELVEPKDGMRILDVGIGTGFLAAQLHERGCIIHGVDFSEKMLEKAKSRIVDGLFDNVDVSESHFGKLNAFRYDRVVSSYFFHHLDHQQKISLIKRTLKDNLLPNGKIIIADIGFANERDFQSARAKYREGWEDDEYYLCGESIVSHLRSLNMRAEYMQISSCAGILTCRL